MKTHSWWIFYPLAILLFYCILRPIEKTPIEETKNSITCGVYSLGSDVKTYDSCPLEVKGGTVEAFVAADKIDLKITQVHTEMCRDKGKFPRYHIDVFINDVQTLSVSHTDIPFVMNVFGKNGYRVICTDN